MSRSRVLLVDDEEIFARNMSKLLMKRGYEVTVVNGGADAIRALKGQDFDVMVLDLKMPGTDGMGTLKQVKKLGIPVETLILTGHGSIETALEAVRLGAYDYLTKPCQIEQLVAKIGLARAGDSHH